MSKLIIFLMPLYFTACLGQKTADNMHAKSNHRMDISENYVWTKLLDSAEWKKSYNFQMFEFRDSLIMMHHDGCWQSGDGMHWIKTPLTNAINNQAFLDYVKFNNAIYGLGYFNGNIESYAFKSEINKTSDFKRWTCISKESNLPNRFFYHPFEFQNKIWIIGGEDKHGKYSDIWNSEDGILWVKQQDNLPFGERSQSQIVELNEKLYLLNNDVWSSVDGLNWLKETEEILKGHTVFGYKAIVFDQKIWLLGCNRDGKFESQIFVSENGKDWTGMSAPWTPRGGIAATVFEGKVYMSGGKYGGITKDGLTTEFIYSNDLWTLEKKK